MPVDHALVLQKCLQSPKRVVWANVAATVPTQVPAKVRVKVPTIVSGSVPRRVPVGGPRLGACKSAREALGRLSRQKWTQKCPQRCGPN